MATKHKLLAVLSALFLTALACARTNSPASTLAPSSLPPGESTRTLTHDGLERSYILYAPTSVNWNQPVPLVLVFHGGTGNAESAIRMSEFNKIADDNGFIVAYPNGAGRLEDKLLTWNGGTCCGYAQKNNVDDIGFIRALIAKLQTDVSIDSKRIYATGMSNGGIMSYRLACEASDLFAAIAPVSGTLNFSPCNPAENVSVIDFHGTADQHIPYEGGFGSESLVDVDFMSVQDSIGFWVSFNECNSQPQTNSENTLQHDLWNGCTNHSSVELYTIIDGGHAWPGGDSGWPGSDQPTDVSSASELMWEFFAAHPKP